MRQGSSSCYDRSWSCSVPRQAVAAAVENASPVARRACRRRSAREGKEAYSHSREARQRRKARAVYSGVRSCVRLSTRRIEYPKGREARATYAELSAPNDRGPAGGAAMADGHGMRVCRNHWILWRGCRPGGRLPKPWGRVRTRLPAGGRRIRTLGPPATVSSVVTSCPTLGCEG
jgi:hypothetical protein